MILLMLMALWNLPRAAPRSNPADDASERTPSLVQQGVTCQYGDVSNILPSAWIPSSSWGYLVKFVDKFSHGGKRK